MGVTRSEKLDFLHKAPPPPPKKKKLIEYAAFYNIKRLPNSHVSLT